MCENTGWNRQKNLEKKVLSFIILRALFLCPGEPFFLFLCQREPLFSVLESRVCLSRRALFLCPGEPFFSVPESPFSLSRRALFHFQYPKILPETRKNYPKIRVSGNYSNLLPENRVVKYSEMNSSNIRYSIYTVAQK